MENNKMVDWELTNTQTKDEASYDDWVCEICKQYNKMTNDISSSVCI